MKILDIITEKKSSLESTIGDIVPGLTNEQITRYLKANPHVAEEMRGKLTNTWDSGIFRALKIIGWLAPVGWPTVSYWALDDIAGLTPEEFTKQTGVSAAKKDQWVADTRSMLLGTFSAQYLIPGIYFCVKYVARFTGVLTIIAGLVGVVVGRSAGGKLMIGAAIVEQAALIAFVNWLGSPPGVKWMTDNVIVGGLIKVTGATLGSIWDLLYRKFFEYSGIQQPAPSNVDQAVSNVSNLPKSKDAPTDDEFKAWNNSIGRSTRVTTDLTPTLPIGR
jgi:hypothetical protein